MIQVNREYDTALRIEASAETRSGAPGNDWCSWWLLAELGPVAREDRCFSAEQRGSLIYDRRGTYVFAVGDQCEASARAGLSMTRSSLQNALQALPSSDPLRGDADGCSPPEEALGRAIDKFVAKLHERTLADGDDGVGALAVVRWPELFFVSGGAAVGYVMHDGRLQRIESELGVRVARRSPRCMAAAAAAGRASALARDENESALGITRTSLAFGDSLLVCSPTVAYYIPQAQMARALRVGASARAAAGALLDLWQRCCCQREATALITRFAFRGPRQAALETAQN